MSAKAKKELQGLKRRDEKILGTENQSTRPGIMEAEDWKFKCIKLNKKLLKVMK